MSEIQRGQLSSDLYGRRSTRPLYPIPIRFSENEWKQSSKLTHKSAAAGQEWAECLMADSIRLADETEEIRLRGQHEVNWQLNQRVQEIQLWIQELTPKADQISESMEEFRLYLHRVNEALDSLPKILEVNFLILRYRYRFLILRYSN